MKLHRKYGRKKDSIRYRAVCMLVGLFVLCVSVLSAGMPVCYGKELPKENGRHTLPEAVRPSRTESEGGQPGTYRNPDTGYRVVIEDRADLLTGEQRRELSEFMEKITAYGNAAFLTTDRNNKTTESLAREYFREQFGTDSGTLFVIDMDNRNIWIHSDGTVYGIITASYADTITDNVYRYASRADYYGCAEEAFREIHALLEGRKISQPMKYISNALLAMILALLANFGLIIFFTRLRKPKDAAILNHIHKKFNYSGIVGTYTHQTKIYDPISRGSSGGGGHSGGGHGGGGHSGGGGGHSF